jgi:UDP-glucose 4-epimerase
MMMQTSKIKKILLLGGAGFLGVNIAMALIRAGFDAFIIDKKCSHLKAEKHLAGVSVFHECDASNFDTVLKFVDGFSIDCVVNLVSTLGPSSSLSAFSVELKSCMLPGFHLVSALAERGVKYVFFSSGGAIYGKSDAGFVPESERCHPISLYGYSKLVFEEYIEYCQRSNSLEYLIIRPSNPYGFYQSPFKNQGFIPVAMNKILNGDEVEIWGDGSVIRDYIWVTDMADALALLLLKNVWNATFNIGSGSGHSLMQVLEVIESITLRKPKIIYRKSRGVDVDRIVLDISDLKKKVVFNPASLSDGVKMYYDGLINGKV